MDNHNFVVLLGDSVLMEGLGESLQAELHLSVIHLDHHSPAFQEQLQKLQPALIVMDLDIPPSAAILASLRHHPGALLLGIDHNSSQVIAMHSHHYPIGSLQEFCHLAQAQLDQLALDRKGGAELLLIDPHSATITG